MKLVTLQIEQTDLDANKRLVKKLLNFLPDGAYAHFFYEPELIIRLENASAGYLDSYLHKRKLKHKIYPYPFGKGYGEAKKGIIMKHEEYFKRLLAGNSYLALNRREKDDYKIYERYTHTFLNQFGYEWVDEVRIHLNLAYGRLGTMRRYELQTVGSRIYAKILMKLISGVIILLRGLYEAKRSKKHP